MRVGFDATLLGTRTTGIALYAEALSTALPAAGAEVVLLGSRSSPGVRRYSPSRSLWFAAELPLRLALAKLDVFHGVNNFQLPLVRSRVPFVITVHDLIPEILPDTVSAKFRWQFRLWIRRTLQLAQAVICVSETTRRDLVARYQVQPSRLRVVHNGVDHVPEAIDDDEVARCLGPLDLPPRYFLYAGALDARKNVGVVLAAMRRLAARRKDVALVVAGQEWFGSDRLQADLDAASKDGVSVRRVGWLTTPVLHAAMRRAVGFVFPSRYEGFGFPPLEAMRLGTPAIVSRSGALPEVCGDAPLYVPAHDPFALADAMERLLDDTAERERRIETGRARAARFTWRRCAEETMCVYRQVTN